MTQRSEAGFSLLELLIAMFITLLIMGGTFSAMMQAMKAQESTKLLADMNGNLRVTMDLVVRDFLQVGQGLPSSKTIQIPNGNGALAVVRPGPGGLTFPTDIPALSAISPGPDLGPTVDGVPTDMITTLAADGSFDQVGVMAIQAQGAAWRVFIDSRLDITANRPSDIRPGDLMMLTKGSASTLLQVSNVEEQWITFSPDDSLRLNQFQAVDPDNPDQSIQGTLNQLMLQGTPDETTAQYNADGTPKFNGTTASRIRMITYYVDAPDGEPTHPRLMRIINGGTPTPVGIGVENLQITYDIADGVTNPVNVRMSDADLQGGGGCGANPCSPNQIRKINVVLAAASTKPFSQTKRPFRNTLFTQVSTRSLAFVDRYR